MSAPSATDQALQWVRTWWDELPELDKVILTGASFLGTALMLVVIWGVLTVR